MIEWRSPQATVVGFYAKLADPELLELLGEPTVTKIGIDAPLGWPLEFVEAVNAYSEKSGWPAHEQRLLTLRATNRWVKEVTGRDPLSVSTDKIAFTAMRCARLLTEYGQRWGTVDRSGAGRIVEVYPAAALRQWGLEPRGYKGSKPEQVDRRQTLIGGFATATQGWLLLTDSDVAQCAQSDHLLDALLAAIVARVAEVGHDLPIPDGSLDRARRDGWIALPARGELSAVDLIR